MYELFAKVFTATSQEKSYWDQTWKFTHKSSRGIEYVFTLYDYDGIIILNHRLKKRQGKEIVDTFTATYLQLIKHGHANKLFILDNECSNDKLVILNTNLKFELVLPRQYRRNAAQRAILISKTDLLAGLAICDLDFPITEWNRLLR